MTVRKTTRRGEPRLVLDIHYIDRRTGKPDRFRRDAEVQTMAAARAEERRKLVDLERLGYIPSGPELPAQPPAPMSPSAGGTPEPPAPEPKADDFTFDEAVKLFRETKAIVELKRTTRRGYEGLFKAHLLPRFKDTPAAAIDREQVTRLDAELVKAGLTPSSRRNVQAALRSVLACAVDAKRLRAMPELPELPKVGRKVVRPPSREDVDLVLSLAYPAARLALMLAADAGLRAGEIRGLRWCDVDLEAGVLFVRQTIYHGEVDTPKSGHEREVPLSARLTLALDEVKKAKQAKKPEPTAPVAPSSRGDVWGEWSLRQAFARVLQKAALPPSRLHDLRHYFVTRCFQVGGDAPTVQALAGHAELSTTQLYAHTATDRKRDLVGRLAS